jgi:hypothetical protein
MHQNQERTYKKLIITYSFMGYGLIHLERDIDKDDLLSMLDDLAKEHGMGISIRERRYYDIKISEGGTTLMTLTHVPETKTSTISYTDGEDIGSPPFYMILRDKLEKDVGIDHRPGGEISN